jgi:transcriptional regulator with XRE-family HTH domain
MTIGEQLRELRQDAGLNQTELGQKAGLSRNTIYRYEAGSDIPVLVFARICAALGADAGKMLRALGEKE